MQKRKMDNPRIMYLIPEAIQREKKIVMRGSLITISYAYEWEEI